MEISSGLEVTSSSDIDIPLGSLLALLPTISHVLADHSIQAASRNFIRDKVFSDPGMWVAFHFQRMFTVETDEVLMSFSRPRLAPFEPSATAYQGSLPSPT